MKSKNKLLFGALTVFFITIMAVSAWKIWEISSEYRKGEDSYDEISRMVSIPPKTATPQPSASAEPAETAVTTEEDPTIWPEAAVHRHDQPHDIVCAAYAGSALSPAWRSCLRSVQNPCRHGNPG